MLAHLCLRLIDLLAVLRLRCSGRPSMIRPGKPLYRHVFQRLANGELAQMADQDVDRNKG